MTRALALLVACVLAARPQDPAPPVFRSASHAVSLDVAVLDGRRVVSTLTADDFEVIDDHVRRPVSVVDTSRLPIDLRLVFDTSGSITESDLEHYRRAMRRVADSLRPDDRCEIVTFTTRVTNAAERQSPPVTIDVRRSLPDGTSFFDAVTLSLLTAPAVDRRQVAVILSDGADNTSFFDEAVLMEAARRTDAVVYTVLPIRNASAESPFVARLRALSMLTGGRLVPARRDAEIGPLLIAAIGEFRHSYVLRYTLQAPVRVGWHPLAVHVRGSRGYTVRVRAGYYVG